MKNQTSSSRAECYSGSARTISTPNWIHSGYGIVRDFFFAHYLFEIIKMSKIYQEKRVQISKRIKISIWCMVPPDIWGCLAIRVLEQKERFGPLLEF